ncbi:hypothetical protein GR268_48615, partial [Rhizobium leguminosarum]|nr:hypothetical protein [Rhizobium leguminosarum]
DKDGNRPLHLAIQQVNILARKRLVDLGIHIIDVKNMDPTSLQFLSIEAVKKVYIQEITNIILQLHLSSALDINVVNKKGYTPLHIAASEGHKELVELLLNLGAQIDTKDKNGNSTMHLAAREGHIR